MSKVSKKATEIVQPPYTETEANPKVSPYIEVGLSGLKRYGGFLQEEFLKDLRGPKGMQVYREMGDNSGIVGSCLQAIEAAMRQVEWRVEPGDGDSAEGKKAQELIETALDDMSQSWDDTLSEILTMLQFGWAYMEVVYKKRGGDSEDPSQRSKYDDGQIGWRKMSLRAQETLFRWQFDDTGGIQGMVQLSAPDYQMRYIPIEKALLFRTRIHKNNPEGRSLLRNAYFSWYFMKRLMEIEAIGTERDLTGLPVCGVPPEIMNKDAPQNLKDQYANIQKILRDIKVDDQMGVIYPLVYDENGNQRFKIELLASPGTRTHDTSGIIARYNQEIASTMLCDFMLIGHTAVGSRALIDPKLDFFMLGMNAMLDIVAEVFNRYAITKLLKLNGLPVDNPPKLVHGEAKSPDLVAIGTYLKFLADSGMMLFPNSDLEDHLMQLAKFPAIQRDKLIMPGDARSETLYPPPMTPEQELQHAQSMSDAKMGANGKPPKPGEKPAPGGKPQPKAKPKGE